jgi:hypothetical protein
MRATIEGVQWGVMRIGMRCDSKLERHIWARIMDYPTGRKTME